VLPVEFLKIEYFKIRIFEENNFNFFSVYVTPGLPMSGNKKCHPIRSSRLAGYKEHLYECLVLIMICYRRNTQAMNSFNFWLLTSGGSRDGHPEGLEFEGGCGRRKYPITIITRLTH